MILIQYSDISTIRAFQGNKHRVDGGFMSFKRNIVVFAAQYYTFIILLFIVNQPIKQMLVFSDF